MSNGIAALLVATIRGGVQGQARPWEGWEMHPMYGMWGAWGVGMMLMMLVFWALVAFADGLYGRRACWGSAGS